MNDMRLACLHVSIAKAYLVAWQQGRPLQSKHEGRQVAYHSCQFGMIEGTDGSTDCNGTIRAYRRNRQFFGSGTRDEHDSTHRQQATDGIGTATENPAAQSQHAAVV